MALSKTLQQFLDRMQVEYEIFLHAPTPSASRTAEASHISADKIAKGVLLKDESGYVLAVLPASHHLDLQEIERVLDSPASLAGELELAEIFRDCELGAVPAVGAAYGLSPWFRMSIAAPIGELTEACHRIRRVTAALR